ncbi:MAG: DUF3237 domain-containing protein [Deltaproteobacteria bacterium]|nr:DUF3237 domain-containing protein [Deltaproteobacteria bacterium]
MRELKTEYLFDAHFTVSGTMLVGDGGWGMRFIGPVTGGTFEGPKIKGTAKSFGADWSLIRHDKVFEVDVRLALETDDGAFIHMYYGGILDFTEAQVTSLLNGEPAPLVARVHTTPRFETGHPKYLWLNRVVGVAIGEINSTVDPSTIDYSVYALR